MSFETIRYASAGPVATITLDRPERLNTIVPPMPDEVQEAPGPAQRHRALTTPVASRLLSGQ